MKKNIKMSAKVKAKVGRVLLWPYTSIGTDFVELRWTLPRSPEAYEQMVKQIAAAIAPPGSRGSLYTDKARAALKSIGITAKPAANSRATSATKGRK